MGKKVKRFLQKLNKDCDLDFKGLIKFIKDNDIPFKDTGMNGPVGIALHNKILLDLVNLNKMPYHMVFFTVLHEIEHYLRLQKLDKDYMINLYKNNNFEAFFEDTIEEELFADKFANLYYHKFNGRSINFYQFKRSEQYKIDECEEKIRPLFDTVNTKKDYKRLFKQLTFRRTEKELEGVI